MQGLLPLFCKFVISWLLHPLRQECGGAANYRPAAIRFRALFINFPASRLIEAGAFAHSRLFEFHNVFLDPAMPDADCLEQTCYGDPGIRLHQFHDTLLHNFNYFLNI